MNLITGNFKLRTPIADIHFSLLILAGLAVNANGLNGERAIGAFFLLLGVVFAHEMGHWVVARWLGYQRRRISLHAFSGAVTGGVATSLRDECLISLAGPAVSMTLGLLLMLIPLPFLRETGYIALAWSALHLLPLFPFDGGRVAYRIWMRTADAQTALKRMVTYSRWFCLAIVTVAFLGAVAQSISWWNFFVWVFVALYLFIIIMRRMPDVLHMAHTTPQNGNNNVATVSPPPYENSRPTKITVTKE